MGLAAWNGHPRTLRIGKDIWPFPVKNFLA
jgi:hypothetical protein